MAIPVHLYHYEYLAIAYITLSRALEDSSWRAALLPSSNELPYTTLEGFLSHRPSRHPVHHLLHSSAWLAAHELQLELDSEVAVADA